jgi:hypothetical protein
MQSCLRAMGCGRKLWEYLPSFTEIGDAVLAEASARSVDRLECRKVLHCSHRF